VGEKTRNGCVGGYGNQRCSGVKLRREQKAPKGKPFLIGRLGLGGEPSGEQPGPKRQEEVYPRPIPG